MGLGSAMPPSITVGRAAAITSHGFYILFWSADDGAEHGPAKNADEDKEDEVIAKGPQ
jgi:hypothetical protein